MHLQKSQRISRSLVIVSSKKVWFADQNSFGTMYGSGGDVVIFLASKPLDLGNFDPLLCTHNFLIAPNKFSLIVYKTFSAVISFLMSQLLGQHSAAFTKRCPLSILLCTCLE